MNYETATMNAGNMEYDADKAEVVIDELIATLRSAQAEGATHVVFLSGNCRGPQYVRIRMEYDWLGDE